MRVRTLLASAVAALGLATAAHASTIFVTLNAVDTGTTALLNGVTAKVWNVEVYAKTDQGETAPGNGDGGIRGFQFDILSATDSLVATSGIAPQAGVPATRAQTTFSAPAGYTTFFPQRVDAGATNGYATDTDTDFDAIGGSLSDPALSASSFDLGKGFSAGQLGTKIATEVWQAVGNQQLNLFVKGPTYYDFTNTGNGSQSNFATVVANGVTLGTGTVPEPTSLAAIGLAGLAALRRRKA